MVKLIDGKALAEKIKDDLIKEILKLKGGRPSLAIIIVGERADSQLYVGLKEKEGKKVGIDIHTYKCAANTSEREIFEMIKFLNADEKIDAILVQLPLPEGFDTDGIIIAIDPNKDLDGFHPNNLERLFNSCDHEQYIPPIIKVILEILSSINYDLQWKKVCIIANSDVFGRVLAWVLKCKNAHTDITSLADPFFAEKMNVADVVISAVGKQPHFIKRDMIKEGAVLIDIGITKVDNKVFGDVDYEDVKDKAGYITPVPGGVGPMTIAMAFKNTLELYKRRHKK
jgi:methylenetetrahydrofolate dehydrogenase (NADP+) / methenyltetrahydrofolate cyclohydrolase